MTFDFDPLHLIVSFLVSGVGVVAFVYGKRQQKLYPMLAGVALLVFPYFVDNVLVTAGITAAVLAALWLLSRNG